MKANWLISLIVVTACVHAQTHPIPATGNVTLSLDEYSKLSELARKPGKKVETPLLPYVLKSAQMNLQVEGESITGQILLEGEIFAKGDRKVPLVSGMIILDAQQQGRELPLEHESGVHSGLFSGPGEFAVTLKIGFPLTIETGRAVFSLPVPYAGTTRLSLTVPGDQTQVALSPGLITRRTFNNGKTTIEATLVPGQTTNIFWAARLAPQPQQAAPKEVRFLSDLKTLISVSDAELGVTALAEIIVIQGEPSQFTAQIPEGYELTGATGATLASSDVQQKAVLLKVNNPAQRNHQFLLSMVKSNSAAKAEIPLISFNGSQRETGEVLVEGSGAMELTATEKGGLRRMDMKEISPYLATLSRAGRHAAFRYQKKTEAQAVALDWVRFPDSNVLSAVAQRAEVTTLVTSEGRSLTEVKLTLKNQAKPFLKVELPAGTTILSSEVAGQIVKPVQGADGSRVPLLRPGFRPSGSYVISFVFMHAGSPFAKKGGAELSLPKMDIPIGLMEWEVFLPQQYKVADFGGDAIAARLLPVSEDAEGGELPPLVGDRELAAGGIGGTVTDSTGAAIAGATLLVISTVSGSTLRAVTDGNGRWVFSNVPSGLVKITASSPGFRTELRDVIHNASGGSQVDLTLRIGDFSEAVQVTASSSVRRAERPRAGMGGSVVAQDIPVVSRNVMDLQRRVAGVLPIAVSIPKTGAAYHFVRPLVVEEETKLTFSYRSK